MNFQSSGKRLDDYDIPRIGAMIGVGEDEIHAVLDVESSGSGFDRAGRLKMLFEPHIFYRLLPEPGRSQAVRQGLAYAAWRPGEYPPDSYPRLTAAMSIDETAALKAASWGLGQILGENHKAAGYDTPQAMVAAFCADEANHLEAMVRFIKSKGIDRALKQHDWRTFARGYNGASYAKNNYDTKLANAFARWAKIKDTVYDPAQPPPVKPVPPLPEPPKIDIPKPGEYGAQPELAPTFGGRVWNLFKPKG